MKRVSLLVLIAMLLSLGLTACGGGGAAATDPAGVVKEMMQMVVDKKMDKIADYACADQKDAIAQQFDFAAALGGGAGLDAQKVLDMMTISIENAEYTKVSEEADKASVQMKGKLVIKIDKEKFKSIMADILKAQGQELPADQLGPLVDQAAASLEQGQDIDNTIDLVKENGKWVVCK